MRYHLGPLLCAAVLITLPGCSVQQPDSSAVAEAGDCQRLQDRTIEFLIDYVEYADTRPVGEAMSVANGDAQPSLLAGLLDGMQQGLSRADDLNCDAQALREQTRAAAVRARDDAQSATSHLLLARSTGDPAARALERTLTVITESQDVHRQNLGVYAISIEELRGQVPDFTRLIPERVDVEVASADQERYCAMVQAPDLPAVYIQGPDVQVSVNGCE